MPKDSLKCRCRAENWWPAAGARAAC